MSKILNKEEWIEQFKNYAGKKNAEIVYNMLVENDIEATTETTRGTTSIELMNSINVLNTTRLLKKFEHNMKTTTKQFYVILFVSILALLVSFVSLIISFN